MFKFLRLKNHCSLDGIGSFNRLILRQFVAFALLVLVNHCRSGNSPEASSVKVNGPIGTVIRQPPMVMQVVSPVVYAKVRRAVVQRVVEAKACRREVSKSVIQNILVSELSQPGVNFQPSETARLIHQVFDPELPVCGREACTQFTGINIGPNLRGEMGALQMLAQKVAPGSVRSFDPRPKSPDQPQWQDPLMLTRRQFCGVGVLTAFSLLNPPLVKAVTGRDPAGGSRSFDLRQDNHSMESQGYTGSCHAFAMAEVLRHGELNLSLDIARYFVDYWTYRLGPNLEAALATEVRFQRDFASVLEKKLVGKKNDEERHEALVDFLTNEYTNIQTDPQGGWPSLDLANMKSRGAVLLGSAGLSKVTFEELGNLTKAIEDARVRTLAIVYQQGQDKLTDQEIRDGVRASLERLYAIAAESKDHPSRLIVKRKLKSYQARVFSFDQTNMEASVELFFKNVKKRPAYLSANRHGTALVGYDQERKIFMVRNSHFETYSELNVDEVFNNLKKYAIIESTVE